MASPLDIPPRSESTFCVADAPYPFPDWFIDVASLAVSTNVLWAWVLMHDGEAVASGVQATRAQACRDAGLALLDRVGLGNTMGAGCPEAAADLGVAYFRRGWLDEHTTAAISAARGELVGMVHDMEDEAAEANRLGPALLVGTDASCSPTDRPGWGWATDTMRGGCGTTLWRSTVNAAETDAIAAALESLDKHRQSALKSGQRLFVYSDSRVAVARVNRAISVPGVRSNAGETDARLHDAARRAALAAHSLAKHGHATSVLWVKGHDGFWLNEAADRLSRLARRRTRAELSVSAFMIRAVIEDARLEHDIDLHAPVSATAMAS